MALSGTDGGLFCLGDCGHRSKLKRVNKRDGVEKGRVEERSRESVCLLPLLHLCVSADENEAELW